jgi:poly(A) polymerase/tRNA nucleotidyltransferase (CCA-adding enzyme)
MAEVDARALDARLAAALPAGSLYAVGGRVRDELRTAADGIPRPAKDLDYVVLGLRLDELVERLRAVGRADLVGAAFAVVKVTIDGTVVDVALPRREHSTGTGHVEFDVEAGPDIPLADDLARRDFRMNMMARSVPEGAIVDPYGGRDDVAARRIDLLRPEAFEEDPLRMLRACQFAARFEFRISGDTMAAMRRAAPLVESVSPERVRDELIKMLEQARRPSIGVEAMREGGLLPYVLPDVAAGVGVEQNQYHRYDVYRHNLETMDATPSGDLTLRLAALFHDVAKPHTKSVDADGAHFYGHESVGADMARGSLERLRFSNAVVNEAERLVRHHMYAADAEVQPRTARRFIRRIGVDLLDRQFALRAADIVGSGLPKRGPENEAFEARVRAILAERPPLSVKDLAVSGNDVIELLVDAGRLPRGSRGSAEVGTLLRRLLDAVLDDPSCNEREWLLNEGRVLLAAPLEDVSRETSS